MTTSAAIPPGLLSAQAWTELHAGPVLAAGDHPQTAALAAAGIDVATGDPREHAPCCWLAAPGDEPLRASLEADPGIDVLHVVGSYPPPGGALLEAVAVMDRLRSPGGCPWDAEQTHASLAPYLLEETYEAYQAIEDGDWGDGLREELGDVLLQVLFHARLAQERPAPWSVDDVAAGLVAKLVRRHPHVFGDAGAAGGGPPDVVDATAVEASWEALKRAEKGRTSAVDGVALGQPALSLVAKLVGRASKAGLPTALPDPEADAQATELLGRALFGLAARAGVSGLDPEAALRTVARVYAEALRAHESAAGAG